MFDDNVMELLLVIAQHAHAVSSQHLSVGSTIDAFECSAWCIAKAFASELRLTCLMAQRTDWYALLIY